MVEIKSLACELPVRRGLPLAHWSLNELRREAMEHGVVAQISGTTLWRWLSQDRRFLCAIALSDGNKHKWAKSGARFCRMSWGCGRFLCKIEIGIHANRKLSFCAPEAWKRRIG